MSLQFKYEKTCLINKSELSKELYKLDKVINLMNEVTKTKYQTDFAFLNLLNETRFLDESLVLARYFKSASLLVVIGIGGSNLGAMAAYQAIAKNKIKILFADTVDSDNIQKIINEMTKCLKEEKEVVINCITKSGTTLETISNFAILLEILKKIRKDYKKYVVVTTNKNSKLWDIAKKENFHILEIPEKVGGRYSVLSNIGLFPLAMAGVDIKKLIEGAKAIKIHCLNKNVLRNPAALSALIMFLHYRRGKSIVNTFLFNNELEYFGKWYRQLLAESIGKEKDSLGRLVNAGMTPIVSIGTTDLHSMMQLYLAGPNDKITTFINVKQTNKLKIHRLKEFGSLLNGLNGRDLDYLMNIILNGVKKTYNERLLPYMEISLANKSEYCIGQLLQLKMMEVVYLAYLLNVNPFDQPNIEEYKEKVRKLLK